MSDQDFRAITMHCCNVTRNRQTSDVQTFKSWQEAFGVQWYSWGLKHSVEEKQTLKLNSAEMWPFQKIWEPKPGKSKLCIYSVSVVADQNI